jgi:hypothetical protein
MTRLRAKRPSPALVISILALFVALGGSAYAASKIGTKQIKNNAITAAKIKNNAVTGAKIKNGAITGAKVDLSSLGTVPSATNAGHAGSAGSADTATTAANFSRYFTSGLIKATPGQTVTLATFGPFTFVGQCNDEGSGSYQATTYLRTSEAHSFSWAYHGGDYKDGSLEPGEEAELGYYASGSSPEWAGENGQGSDWSAANSTGSILLQGFSNNGVHVFGAACAFNLTWTSNA